MPLCFVVRMNPFSFLLLLCICRTYAEQSFASKSTLCHGQYLLLLVFFQSFIFSINSFQSINHSIIIRSTSWSLMMIPDKLSLFNLAKIIIYQKGMYIGQDYLPTKIGETFSIISIMNSVPFFVLACEC